MTDLRARFASIDRIPVPDLWPEIQHRAILPQDFQTSVHPRRATPPDLAPRQSVLAPIARQIAIGALAALVGGIVFVAAQQPSPSPERAIVWETRSARLEADALETRAGDKVFVGEAPYELGSSSGVYSRTLEAEWTEDGLEQRLNIYFAADLENWWIAEVRTYDGYRNGDWITYVDPEMIPATPRGETYKGDLHLKDGRAREDRDLTGELIFRGLRLTAFAPGTGPLPLTGCEHVSPSVRRGAESPLDKGQPLAGWDIEGMRPKRAESLLRDIGICFSFSYYRPTRQEDIAYSERWCTAPPTGRISGAPSYGEDGEVILYVEDGRLHPIREQPPTGWNCPLD